MKGKTSLSLEVSKNASYLRIVIIIMIIATVATSAIVLGTVKSAQAADGDCGSTISTHVQLSDGSYLIRYNKCDFDQTLVPDLASLDHDLENCSSPLSALLGAAIGRFAFKNAGSVRGAIFGLTVAAACQLLKSNVQKFEDKVKAVASDCGVLGVQWIARIDGFFIRISDMKCGPKPPDSGATPVVDDTSNVDLNGAEVMSIQLHGLLHMWTDQGAADCQAFYDWYVPLLKQQTGNTVVGVRTDPPAPDAEVPNKWHCQIFYDSPATVS